MPCAPLRSLCCEALNKSQAPPQRARRQELGLHGDHHGAQQRVGTPGICSLAGLQTKSCCRAPQLRGAGAKSSSASDFSHLGTGKVSGELRGVPAAQGLRPLPAAAAFGAILGEAMQESQLFPGVGNAQRVPGVPCKQPRRRKGALCHRGDGDTAQGARSPPGPAPCGVQELWRGAGGTDRGVPTSANIPTAPPPPPSPTDKTPPGQWAAHVGCPACHGMKESKQGEQTALAFSSCSSLAKRQSQHPDGTHPTPAWGKKQPGWGRARWFPVDGGDPWSTTHPGKK